jgi:hypothetical protein
MVVNHFGMQSVRALVATNPLNFGRGRARRLPAEQELSRTMAEDAQLFAATFAAGFLFVSILIG